MGQMPSSPALKYLTVLPCNGDTEIVFRYPYILMCCTLNKTKTCTPYQPNEAVHAVLLPRNREGYRKNYKGQILLDFCYAEP